MKACDQNRTRFTATALTRLRAVVIGGGVVAGALILTACASTTEPTSSRSAALSADLDSSPTDTDSTASPLAPPSPAPARAPTATEPPPKVWTVPPSWASGATASATSPLAAQIVELPDAPVGPVTSVDVLEPIGLRIPSLGIDEALIVDVGVEENGDFEVPPATEVGWYRFGPTPGEAGSAVLAAHIAQGGVDGVFRYLADIEVGATFSVIYEDGSEADYRVTALDQYDKDELPTEELFRKTGDSQLVLITCGGDFNRQIRSYDDNVVAIAIPI